MRYLLDSSVVINWLNGMPEAERLLTELVESGEVLALNAVSVAETYSSLADDERAAADALIGSADYWELTVDEATLAGAYRYQYARQGVTLSVPDMLLAAQAVSRDATLVTGNVRHFPMPELRLLRVD